MRFFRQANAKYNKRKSERNNLDQVWRKTTEINVKMEEMKSEKIFLLFSLLIPCVQRLLVGRSQTMLDYAYLLNMHLFIFWLKYLSKLTVALHVCFFFFACASLTVYANTDEYENEGKSSAPSCACFSFLCWSSDKKKNIFLVWIWVFTLFFTEEQHFQANVNNRLRST